MECIHYNILSISSFSIQNVVPTASASADHDHDEDYDSSELEFNSDTDDMDDEGLTLSDEEWIAHLPVDSPIMSLPIPSFLIDSDDSLHSPSLPLHTPDPPASPDPVIQPHADGTITLSSDDEVDFSDAASIAVSDTVSEHHEDQDLAEQILIPEEGELIEVVPDDDAVSSESEDAQSGNDYGDEPDDWTDDFDGEADVFEDNDYGDGFDDSSDGW